MQGAVPGRVCHVCSLLHRTHRLVKERISNNHKIIIVEREVILWKYLTVELEKQMGGGRFQGRSGLVLEVIREMH